MKSLVHLTDNGAKTVNDTDRSRAHNHERLGEHKKQDQDAKSEDSTQIA
jgi:hypothetical protein